MDHVETQVLDAGAAPPAAAQGSDAAPLSAAPQVPSTDLVPVAADFVYALTDGLFAKWLAKPKTVFTNVKGDTEEGKARLSKMMTKAELDKDTALTAAFGIVGYVMHEVTHINQETGEERPGVRMCFVDAKGRTLDTCSGPCLDGLRTILSLYGPGPWDPPIPIRVRKMPSRNHPGGSYYVLYAEPRQLPEKGRTK